MSLVAKEGSSGGDFAPCPQGSHSAVCCAIIDLGTQYSERYDSTARKVLLGWEVNELRNDGERFVVWSRYTLSLHEKASLRKILESWRGRAFTAEELKGFDLENIMGKPCMVSITHRESGGRTYTNVMGVSSLPKGMEPLEATKQILFDVNEPDMDVFNEFRDSLKATIEDSTEWKAKTENPAPAPEPPAEDFGTDELPF